MKEKKFMYILTEDEKQAVEYAIDYFFESAPYILKESMFLDEKDYPEERAGFQAIVDTLESLTKRMGGGASE